MPRRRSIVARTLADRFLLCSQLTHKEERALLALCKFGDQSAAAPALGVTRSTLVTQINACRSRLQVHTTLQTCLIYQQFRLRSGCSLTFHFPTPQEGTSDE